MNKKIVTYPDPILAQKSVPVADITQEVRTLADDMVETMYSNDGIGLAAPQVAENIRLVTVDISGPKERDDLRILINPEIVESSGTTESEEGCLSVVGYRAKVKRAARVGVKALDLDGNPLEIEAQDLLAICLQHEIDHLDGILFIDHISRLKRTLYEKKLAKWLKTKRRDAKK
ncbi:peptide deformylase [Desulfoplanes formicivorans]|uniref:Peptide deformylase n=1 Tax=Desulfoplanes formicivorans TaxID=1592317 RepID=A0A194AI51_9BACT|nr:peptide deformylase [Desulfoplanes formicivorans]GAU08439.1 peptide deformylase [Desulfoplanes formicivorans]